MDALRFVQACLERSDQPLSKIARESGVGGRWLYEFAKGKIPEPGYSKVMLLADYFHRVGVEPVLSHSEHPQAAGTHRHQMG